MRFEHPYLLLVLLLLPLLALAYIRRAGRREATLPSLALWRAVAAEGAAETGKRLGGLDLPLLFALLFVAASVLAASGPVILVGARQDPTLLLILDRSASMGTRTGSARTRWQESVGEATRALDRMPSGGRVLMLGLPFAAGPGPTRLRPVEARDRLASLEPTELPLGLVRELSRCGGVAAQASAVIVITDNAAVVPQRLAGRPVVVISHGGPSRNVAIDAFEVSRGAGGPLTVFAAVKNYSPTPADVPLKLLADGVPVEAGRLRVAPGARATFTSSAVLGDAAEVELRLLVDDDLACDNRSFAVRSGGGPVRVAYVGRGNPFIRRALQLLPDVAVSEFRLSGHVKGGFDLFLFDGVMPDVLPEGDVVLIDPVGQVGPVTVEGVATDAAGLAAAQLKDSALLYGVDAGALRFKRVIRVRGDAEVLLKAGEGAALLRWADGKSRVTVIGCGLNLSETNWPMLASFPIFWANLVAEAAGRRNAADIAPAYSLTGELVAVRVSQDARAAVTGPTGERTELAPGPGARAYFRPTRGGVYRITGSTIDRARAANMLHETESDNAGVASNPVPDPGRVLAPTGGIGIPFWRLCAVLALGFALAYWMAAARVNR